MRPRNLPLFFLALSTAGAAVGGAACLSGNGAAVPSPTLAPTPPFTPADCQIVWEAPALGSTAGVVDAYLVDVAFGSWTVGTHGYLVLGTGARGIFYRGYDLFSGTFLKRSIATTGSFSLTAASDSAGGFVSFADASAHPYQLLGTAGQLGEAEGTSGTGTFAGLLSDPFSTQVTPGAGTMSVLFEGTAHLLGQDSAGSLSYSICSSTPQSPTPKRPPK